MLGINNLSFKYFQKEVFSTQCINKTADNITGIEEKDIDNHPALLENMNFCQKIISLFPNLVKKMHSEQITSENEIIDFEVKDISLNYKLKVGDLVEFRVEQKFPDIKIARNIAPFLPQD